ncbi:hypothetical protein EV2_035060 [Malus domestica]
MDGLPARGVRKREIIPDIVEVINLEDDNAAQDKKKTCKKVEGSNADQEKMMLMQLYSTTRSEKNVKMLLKILEDSAKSLNNIGELERIREENKVHVKEERAVEAKKPETQKKDVERKPRSQPETQKDVERKKKPEVVNKNGREEAGSSRPALHPAADERDRAGEEARKKTIPCARCGGTNTKFRYFNHGDLRKDTRKCHDCNRAWVVGAKLR